MTQLEIFIEDCKRLLKMQESLDCIETTKLKNPLDELLEYGIKYDIIENAHDLVKFSIQVPPLAEKMSELYDDNINKKNRKAKRQRNEEYKYAGTYDKLSDVPGYGTEWNSRCIPSGVVIRNKNGRC